MNREILLGYLMNALEDTEMSSVERELLRQPELREQLAAIQQEISPLACVGEISEPPHHLARRTCDKVWASVNKEELYRNEFDTAISNAGEDTAVSMPVFAIQSRTLDSALERSRILQEILAVSPNAVQEKTQENNVEKTVKRLKRSVSQPAAQKPVRRFRRLDVPAAVAVGILLAVVIFPTVNGGTKQQPGLLVTQAQVKAPQVLEPQPETAVLNTPVIRVDSNANFVPFAVQTQGRDIILGQISEPLPSPSMGETKNGWQNISFSTPDIANQTRIFNSK